MFIISKCIITFPSFQKAKQNKTNKQNNNNNKNKTNQLFLLDNYLMGYLFSFDWDVVNMQFTTGLVSSYLLNSLKGKQSSSCMVISLDLTKVLFSITGFLYDLIFLGGIQQEFSK